MVVTNINSLNVIAAAPQQARSAETNDGFSETLDAVNNSTKNSSFKTKDAYSYTKQAGESLRAESEANADVSVSLDEQSAEVMTVVEKAMEMLKVEIETDAEADGLSEDDILDMLIKLIDKMREDEDDTTCDAAIEMLLSILGTESFKNVQSTVEITAVSAEISEISFETSEAPATVDYGESEASPVTTAQNTDASVIDSEGFETALNAVEIMETKNEMPMAEPTESAPIATAETEEGQPNTELTQTEKLLSDILEKAKKELGLTEVKISDNATTEEPDVQPQTASTREMPMNISRNDRTAELRTILGEDTGAENTQTATETSNAVHMAENLVDGNAAAQLRNPEIADAEIIPEEPRFTAPEVQAAEQILSRMENLSNGETEFTMVLNPESLGKITVKLLTVGEKVAVEITAEKASTQQLLDARSENLQSMLRDNGVQLERYQVVAENENAELMQESYDGSSKNPYARQEDNSSEENDGENSFYELLQSL